MLETYLWILTFTTIGFVTGYLFAHYKNIKSDILYLITTIKEDVINLTVKVEQYIKKPS